MAKAWVTQPTAKLKALGPDQCPWVREWYDPAGGRRRRTFGPGDKGRKLAEKYRERVSAELLTGTYADKSRTTWDDLVRVYREVQFPRLDTGTREVTEVALAHFARVAKPKRADAIDAEAVARFAAKRLTEPGLTAGRTAAPATVNKELRHLKAVLRFAADHGHLKAAPRVRFLKEPRKLPRVMEPDRLTGVMAVCDAATLPAGLPGVAPGDWWRALLAFLFMGGWRIDETLKLAWADVDLDAGFVVTRAKDNKAGRDERLPLHPAAAALVAPLRAAGTPEVFPWPHHRRTLYTEFAHVQRAAGVTGRPHGFHDLRRAFATYNAAGLGADVLQKMMRHTSYLTTKRYIKMAEDLSPVVGKLFVPDVLKTARSVPPDDRPEKGK